MFPMYSAYGRLQGETLNIFREWITMISICAAECEISYLLLAR